MPNCPPGSLTIKDYSIIDFHLDIDNITIPWYYFPKIFTFPVLKARAADDRLPPNG
jgi:hypothetical protein